jgi:hypothetical protein
VAWPSRRAALWIQAGCLALAAVITVVAMLHGAAWNFRWSWFYPWALAPYLLLLSILLTVGNKSRPDRIAGMVASVAVLAFSLTYLDAMLLRTSSTSALVFLFGPLYLLAGGPAALAIATFVARKVVADRDDGGHG